MLPISVVGMFCEDIREEKGNLISLTGIFPDNAYVSEKITTETRISIPKLALYLRIHFDPKENIGPISTKLILPDGKEVSLGVVDEKVINQTLEETRKSGAPIACIVSRIQLSPFPLTKLGRLACEVTIGKKSFLCAALNFTNELGAVQAVEHKSRVVETL